jgi:hypothetical protein
MSSKNDCYECEFTRDNTPTLATMQEEINIYVNNKLETCLNNFQPFLDKGFAIRQTGDVVTTTNIIDKVVLVKVDLPLQIEREGKSYSLEEFAVNLPVDLKKVFDLAMKILKEETNVGFLEHTVISMIAQSSSLDSNALPPFYAIEMSSDKVIWSKQAVKEKLKDLLATYIPFSTIPDTHNFKIYRVDESEPGYEVRQGMYMLFVHNILQGEKGFENIDASFNYLNWPIYFDITPSDGELIVPDEMDSNFLNMFFFFSRVYPYKYDISYPVVIELRDSDAFNQQGYSFMFAVENNIRNNEVLRGDLLNTSLVGRVPRASIFGEESQRISGEIRVFANSGTFDRNPIEKADIRYICGPHSVNIGKTDEDGRYVGPFPLCKGGVIKVTKNGYYGDAKYLDTEIDRTQVVNLELFKIEERTAKIKIRWPEIRNTLHGQQHGELSFSELRNLLRENSKDITENETVFMTITKVTEDVDLPFNEFITFEKGNEEVEINLVPGTYEINAHYMWLPGIYIPPRTEDYEECDVTGLICTGDEIELPEFEMTPSPLGGAILNNETGYWIVKENELEDSESVTFYILRETEPDVIEKLVLITNNVDSSKGWRSLIEPSWE